MIYIEKYISPTKFNRYAITPQSHFDDMPSDVKKELRRSLLAEQGYLCAYCMKRIDEEHVKIEHYEPRSPENELEYGNLFAVCSGGEGTEWKYQTCDSHKGNHVIHINPQRQSDIDTLSYDSNGYIYSKSPVFQDDINKILNLNSDDAYGLLPNNRRQTLQSFKNNLYHKLKQKSASERYLNKLLSHYSSKNENGRYLPYCGIIIWYLKKRIGRI